MIQRRGKKGLFTHIRRVPKRYRSVDSRTFVSTALHTKDDSEAFAKATDIEKIQDLAWESALAGKIDDKERLFRELTEIAEMRGYTYLQASKLSETKLSTLLQRTDEISKQSEHSKDIVADALLGAADAPDLQLSGLVEYVERLTADKRKGSSDIQKRSWQNARKRAVSYFLDALGGDNRVVNDLDHSDGLKMRNHLWKLVETNKLKADTANKQMAYLAGLLSALRRLEKRDIPAIFSEMKFEADTTRRVPFSPKWIRDTLLAPDALNGLNNQARDILLTMINTGCRPSEICGLKRRTIRLDQTVPHIVITSEPDRKLKTTNSERVVPLTGVSLEAMRRNPDGFSRYSKPTNWSNTVGKYLRENHLLETEQHTAYSLRHSFQDALQNINCPDRTRKELMGHAIDGVIYGQGANLENKLHWLEQIAHH